MEVVQLEGLADVQRVLPQPDAGDGGPPSTWVWGALCQKVMTDLRSYHELSPEEKEEKLRTVVVPVPGALAGRTIRLLESPYCSFPAGTGSVLWPAAMALIELIDRQVHADSSLRAIELGAGLGSVGIFLAQHKGLDVVVTDQPEAMSLLERNVGMNSEGKRLKAHPLVWGDPAQLKALGSFDLVVGSDVTYRPECLDELLGSIRQLLRPGGRAFLTLQDRAGEAALFRDAMTWHPSLRLDPHPDVRRRLNVLPDDDGTAEEGEEVTVKQFELTLDLGEGPLPSSPDEVEAEFERLTGIKPERMVPAAACQQQRREPAAAPSARAPLGERIRSDLVRQGLGDFLDGSGQHPTKLLEAAAEQQTAPEEQGMAEARRAAASAPAADDLAWESACAQQVGGGPPPPDATAAPSAAAPAPPAEGDTAGRSLPGPSSCAETVGVEAEVCLDGLTWHVDVDEAQSQLSAVVTFGEEVWRALRGPGEDASTDAAAFRSAVDFELAEEELQVLHAGAVVLQLRLLRHVDPHAAAAKLCSRRRRVTVRAPLKGRG